MGICCSSDSCPCYKNSICPDCKTEYCGKCFLEKGTLVKHFNIDNSKSIDSKQINIIEQLTKKILKETLELNIVLFAEFIFKYPGICTDYTDSEYEIYRCGQPSRTLAPCIMKPFEIWPVGTHNDVYITGWLPSNISDAYNIAEFKVFGDPKTTRRICERVGCEVLHSKTEVTFNEKQNELRKKFNNIELKYADILKLWEPLYDEKIHNLVEIKYKKFFACKIKNKFASNLISNIDELEQDIKKEIGSIIWDLRSSPEYYKQD